MDLQKMMEIVRQKHGVRLDPDDSIFLLATIADELQKEGREELAKIAAAMTDQVSTTLVLAGTTARSRSERIVTEAAQWSGEQIRLAGAEASRLVLAQMETPVAQSRSAARTATIAAWISGSAAICAVLAIVWLVR